ncbi:solanesyl diphosphate synthase [Micractinium conductrix]|uniref:Solanesyl diphosphate synthase n=1 Tax=Micractinium conductrix TaxID=554055 RepID=A0A2P6VPZ2_9CHLO|nr:solanesyl diphosphate synthase [Micractinium conductrix]|eukprot:PSC76152.1 solanesyl diphosphate synthase [Micractinium conductrix]
MHATMLVEQVHNSGSRAVWSRPPQRSASGACPPRRAARASARVQALQGDAEELRRVPRGSAAAPLRVYSPVAEAAAAPTAAPPSDDDASCRCLPDLGHAPVTMEHVSAPVVEDMAICRQNLLNVVGERHPMLLAAANQIFSAGGKRLRPLICLLVARATYPLTGLSDITERHRRLAEISEMLHTASLVHDDVLDECDTRRGKQTVNSLYGTRVAVLAGDFLFAQSSWFLANLDNMEVIKLISQVIADFADGEISQAASLFDTSIDLPRYLDKSFWKTASLIAASCRSAAVFSDCSEEVKEAMYAYGKHLGLAFQVVDDILDFTQSSEQLGKPQGQDLASGNLTAPAIYALQDEMVGSGLLQLIQGRFRDEGSLQRALELVSLGGGIEKARALAREEGDLALASLACLPDTPAKRSLEQMVDLVLERLSARDEPPQVVLVPPLLERERKGRSRFAKSSYEYLFAKPQLKQLFGDYLGGDLRGIISFSPPEDQRVNVTAKLGVPRPGAYSPAAGGKPAPPPGGAITLRFQPLSDNPYTFFDVKARTRGPASAAAVRGCLFDARSRMAVWAELPVVATNAAGPVASPAAAALRLGAKYTSPGLSAGLVVNPASSQLQQAFLVAKLGGLVVGAQTVPALHLDEVFAGGLLDRHAWATVARQCQQATSFAVAYQPEAQTGGYGGRFTAAVELVRDRELTISFLHHMAVQRRVRNPFESSDVVGITNYLDVGFRMTSDIGSAAGSQMQLAASWQANKNVMVKAQVGLHGASVATVFKSWWQPAFTLAGAAGVDWATGRTRIGLTAAVETFKSIRYERSAAAQKMSGARITQRHVASDEDVAYAAGKGLLVPLDEVDNPQVLGQTTASGDEFL